MRTAALFALYGVVLAKLDRKTLAKLHVGCIAATYAFLVLSKRRNDREMEKTLPQYKVVYKFNRLDRTKSTVFHLLLNAAMTTPVFLKLVADNYQFIAWTDFYVLKALLARFVVSIAVSLVSVVEKVLFWRALSKQKVNEEPIFILGHFRSGTTLLHNLVNRNTEDFHFMNSLPLIVPNGCLLLHPLEDKLSELLDREDRWVDNIPYRFKDGQEDHIAIAQDIGIGHALSIILPKCFSKFSKYFAMNSDKGDRELYKSSLLKLMRKVAYMNGDKEGKKRMVLKSPTHTAKIELILEMFPKAQFIYVHREPFRLFLSMTKLMETFLIKNDLTNATDNDLQGFIITQYMTLFREYQRTKHLVPKGNLVEFAYEELSSDKVGTMEKIYSELSWKNWDKMKDKYEDFKKNRFKKNQFVEMDEDLKELLRDEFKEAIEFFGYNC